jgi:Fe2+ or Zn2+ uptake regulation protein
MAKKAGRSAAELLRAADMRATPQRIKLLDIVRARHRPMSVEDVVTLGKRAFDTTTAYRTLETLRRRGIVRRIDLDKKHALYEMAEDHHHHAVCVSCGIIRDVSMCISPSLDEKVRAAVRFERIDSHALEFFGMCAACATGSPRTQ